MDKKVHKDVRLFKNIQMHYQREVADNVSEPEIEIVRVDFHNVKIPSSNKDSLLAELHALLEKHKVA